MGIYNANQFAQNISGLGGISEVYMVTTSTASSGYPRSFWGRWFKPRRNLYDTIAEAEAALQGGINEVVLLSPESHSLSSALTWDKSNSALIGLAPDASFMNQRSRIGMSADFAAMMTVSGNGNLFKNLYFMHGRGNAANLNCLTVSGDRNVFVGCHFAGPQNEAEAAAAGYDLIRLDGAEETIFRGCTIGNVTITSTTTNLVELQADAGAVMFEDCIFLINSGGADNTVLKLDTGGMDRPIIFKNCIGISTGTACTLAITGDYLKTHKKVYLFNTDFSGFTDVCSANNESHVISMAGSALRASDASNSLGVAYDHTD